MKIIKKSDIVNDIVKYKIYNTKLFRFSKIIGNINNYKSLKKKLIYFLETNLNFH